MADVMSYRVSNDNKDQSDAVEWKSPSESMDNCRLPVDIFAVIAENIVDQPHTLAILARTCHVIQYVSERVLYRTITYEHQSKRAEKICDALNNRTAKYVKELIITDIRQAVPDVLFDEIPSTSFISSLFEYVVPPFHLMDRLQSLSFLVAENCPSLSPNVVVALHDIEGNVVEYDPYRGLWDCFVTTFQGSLKTFRCTLNLPSSDFSFLARQAPSIELLQMSTAVPINLPCTPNLRTLEITALSLHSMLKDTEHLYESFPRAVHPQTTLVLDLRRFQGLPPLLLKSVEWHAVPRHLVAIDLSGLATYQPELYAGVARSFPNLRVLNGVKLFRPQISTDGFEMNTWVQLLYSLGHILSLTSLGLSSNSNAESYLCDRFVEYPAPRQKQGEFTKLTSIFVAKSITDASVNYEKIKNPDTNEWDTRTGGSVIRWWRAKVDEVLM